MFVFWWNIRREKTAIDNRLPTIPIPEPINVKYMFKSSFSLIMYRIYAISDELDIFQIWCFFNFLKIFLDCLNCFWYLYDYLSRLLISIISSQFLFTTGVIWLICGGVKAILIDIMIKTLCKEGIIELRKVHMI